MWNTWKVGALAVATMIGLLATAQAAYAFNEIVKPGRQTGPATVPLKKSLPPAQATTKKTSPTRSGDRNFFVDETGVVRPKP